MTGDEHYREAEHLLEQAADHSLVRSETHAQILLARAQVHATLAQAAATWHTSEFAGTDTNHYGGWWG